MPRRCQQGIHERIPGNFIPEKVQELLLPTRAPGVVMYSQQGPNTCYNFTGLNETIFLPNIKLELAGGSIPELEVEQVMCTSPTRRTSPARASSFGQNKSGEQVTCLYHRQPGLGLHMLRLRRAAAGWKSLGLHKASASFWFLLCLCVSQHCTRFWSLPKLSSVQFLQRLFPSCVLYETNLLERE
jgi:hypothetical protein